MYSSLQSEVQFVHKNVFKACPSTDSYNNINDSAFIPFNTLKINT